MSDKITLQRAFGPYEVGGKLFFKLLDGSTISCECVGQPYVTQIVETINEMINEARSQGYKQGANDFYGRLV